MALRFGSPRGASVYSFQSFTRGPRGPAATVQLGTVTELDPGEPPTITNSGTDTAAVINFGLPGTATVEVGDVTALPPGSTPAVTNGGTPTQIKLDFDLPTTPTISIGTVTTVDPNDPATVTDTGDAENIVLDFEIPQGVPGQDGEMAGPGASVDGEIALYNGTSGTTLKRLNSTGILKATSGVAGVATAGTDYLAPADIGVTVQSYDPTVYSPETRIMRDVTGATDTLTLGDAGNIVVGARLSGDLAITVPPDSDVAFVNGTQIDIVRDQAGELELVQGTGVTIKSEGGSKKLSQQNSPAVLLKRGTDTWMLFGSLKS